MKNKPLILMITEEEAETLIEQGDAIWLNNNRRDGLIFSSALYKSTPEGYVEIKQFYKYLYDGGKKE